MPLDSLLMLRARFRRIRRFPSPELRRLWNMLDKLGIVYDKYGEVRMPEYKWFPAVIHEPVYGVIDYAGFGHMSTVAITAKKRRIQRAQEMSIPILLINKRATLPELEIKIRRFIKEITK